MAQALNKTKRRIVSVKSTKKITEAMELVATVKPDNASNPAISWTSSDLNVATVDANGLVTAIKEGSTIIRAESIDVSSKFAECEISVQKEEVKVISVSLNEETQTLKSGETFTLTATIVPKDATEQGVNWTSNDINVATVDNLGVVTAKKGGTATITVTTHDGSKTASCVITVIEDTTTSLSITNKISVLDCNSEFTFSSSIIPTSEANYVKWSSSNENIATVSDGVVKTKGVEGKVTITVSSKFNKKSDSCEITVKRNYLKGDDGKYNYLSGIHLSSSGTTSSGAGKWTTEYIPIKAGDILSFNGFEIINNGNMNACIYDNSKTKLYGAQVTQVLFKTSNIGGVMLHQKNNLKYDKTTNIVSEITTNAYYDGSKYVNLTKDVVYYLRFETFTAPTANASIYIIHNN